MSKAQKKKLKKHLSKVVKSKEARRKLADILDNPSVLSALRAILYTKDNSAVWRGIIATPPGSLLELVLAEFMSKTSIAAELVFMSTICLMAQYMAERGATLVMKDGQEIRLDLMTILLASSGQSKSFTASKLMAAFSPIWVPNIIADAGSTAGLLTSLKENEGKAALWRAEEFGEFWRQTRTEVHAGTPRVILMAYDGATISKQLKTEKLEIVKPYLSIFGTTVTENLAHALNPDDWLSGLCARLCFVLCPRDSARAWNDRKYALLDELDLVRITDEFRKLVAVPIHKQYRLSSDARTKIKDAWVIMGQQELDEAFVRRVEFRAFKYAVVYHWLQGKTSDVIDAQDINWAFRLSLLHLSDLKVILDPEECHDYKELVRVGEELRKKHGANFTPRHIQMRLHRKLKNSDESKAVFLLVLEAAAKAGATNLPPLDRIKKLVGDKFNIAEGMPALAAATGSGDTGTVPPVPCPFSVPVVPVDVVPPEESNPNPIQ
jgi:hypothetical protein